MKKIISLSVMPLAILPILPVISCGSSSDYYEMPWEIDGNKVNEIKNNGWQGFNSEPLSIDKLKKVIKGDGTFIDRYTKEAFDQGWFEKIEFETNKDNQPQKLVISMKSKIDLPNNKSKSNPYRFSNGKLEIKY